MKYKEKIEKCSVRIDTTEENKEAVYMTIAPMYKICPMCLRKYVWNPDVGQLMCPYCGKKGIPGIDELPRKIFKKNVWKKRK